MSDIIIINDIKETNEAKDFLLFVGHFINNNIRNIIINTP